MQKDLLAKLIIDTLQENKALDINELDIRELTDIIDSMIICSATSTRHAKTLSDKVQRASKAEGVRPIGVEGDEKCDWILIDLGDIVVHIMMPETREFYSLEKLWSVTEAARKKAVD